MQKTALQVDETGTKAAAVTGIICVTSCCGISLPQAVSFDANHPFLFAICDRATNAILFLGSMNDPTIGTSPQAAVPATPPGDPSNPVVAAPASAAAATQPNITTPVVAAAPSGLITVLQSQGNVLNAGQDNLLM